MTPRRGLRLALTAVAILALPQLASACPVCFGDPNSSIAKGASNGVLFMIGIVAFVQIGFVALFWNFRKRMKALAAENAAVAGHGLRVAPAPPLRSPGNAAEPSSRTAAYPGLPPQPAPRNP
jgi:hypothetical protein